MKFAPPAQWDIAWGLPESVRLAKIYVDGVEQRHVRSYDAEAGWVRKLVLNEMGQAQLTPDREDVLEETVYGNVEVR